MDLLEIITIDGPVGVGKSSVSRDIAKYLGYTPMDTGAMYRAVTLAAMEKKIDTPEGLSNLSKSINITLEETGEGLRVYINNRDVTEAIREPLISKKTSNVSDVVGVRERLVEMQRNMGKKGRYVCEGRDQGTVVFPEAKWKIYLDADIKTRVERRALQLEKDGKKVELDKLQEQVIERDFRDKTRSVGALKIPADAIIFDTTNFNKKEVVEILVTLVEYGNKIIDK